MALKNLFDMVKADKYTADGREALIKAQEAETEDKVYQIGEISQKTGLQKTANGWVKPKNGKQPGTNKPAENKSNAMPKVNGPDMAIRNFERKGEKVTNWNGTKNGFLISTTKGDYQYVEKADGSFELMDRPNVTQGEALQQSIKSHGEKAESKPNPNGVVAQQKQKLEAEKYEAARRDAQAPSKKTEVNTPGLRKDVQEAIKRSSPEEIKAYIKELRTPGSRMSRYFDNPDLLANVYEDELNKMTESKPAAESQPAEKLPAKPTRGMSESYIRGTQLMKPAEDESQRGEQHWAGVLSGYDNTSVIEQRKQLQEKYDEFEEDIKDYDRRGLAPAVYAKRINQQNFIKGALKAIDDEMENRGMDPAPRTSVPDAAPRQLTGDCKIRVRKA